MSERRSVDTAAIAHALRRWLFSGKCQSESGAFCGWRDAGTGQLAFEYPEITGYLLTFVAGLPDLTPDELAAARRGADWLVGRLGRGDYSARSGWDGGAVYTFDLGMVASGLISFGRLHGDEYVETGMRVVRFLVSESEAAGKVPAVARGPEAGHPGWATEGRAHLLKLVQCLLLGDELGVIGARDWAKSLIGEAAVLQQSDGRFVTDPRDEVTMLHPHQYALEGLWIWGRATSEQSALERARRGVEWVLAHQLESGGFPRFVRVSNGEASPEQGDATAQVMRLRSLTLGLDTPIPELERAAERLVGTMTVGSAERAAVYQPSSSSSHENAWVTMFAAQAIDLISKRRALPWSELV